MREIEPSAEHLGSELIPALGIDALEQVQQRLRFRAVKRLSFQQCCGDRAAGMDFAQPLDKTRGQPSTGVGFAFRQQLVRVRIPRLDDEMVRPTACCEVGIQVFQRVLGKSLRGDVSGFGIGGQVEAHAFVASVLFQLKKTSGPIDGGGDGAWRLTLEVAPRKIRLDGMDFLASLLHHAKQRFQR